MSDGDLVTFARSVAKEPWAVCMMSTTCPSLRRLGAELILFNARRDKRLARLAGQRAARRSMPAARPKKPPSRRIQDEVKVQELGHVIRYAEKVGVGLFVKTLISEAEQLSRTAVISDRTRRMVLRLYAQRMRTAAIRLVLDAGMQRVLVDRR